MSRPDEVPKWARCEHQGGSLVDWRWTDADGWLHTVTVDTDGDAGEHTLTLIGVDRGEPQWELECDHDGSLGCDAQAWWSEQGINLVHVPWFDVQPMISLRAEWRNSGELRLVALKGVDDE